MAYFSGNRPLAQGMTGGLLGLSIGDTLAAIGTWNDKRVTRRELNKLSNRELEDIGLCRADIDQVVEQIR
jgi:uncharacterized protein YjiS (DUF1127 family)